MNGGQRDETDPIGEVRLHRVRDCQPQARLAHASRTGEGQ